MGSMSKTFSLQRANRGSKPGATWDSRVEHPVLIFIGSGYGPNTEAAMFLVKEVARICRSARLRLPAA